MLSAVNGTKNVYQVPQTEPVQPVSYNVAMRGASDYERIPDADTFEPRKKHTGRKVLGWTIALAGAGSAIWAFCKGKNAGVEGIWKQLGHGYKEIGTIIKEKSIDLWNKITKKGN